MKSRQVKLVSFIALLLFIGVIVYMAFTYKEVTGTDDKINGVVAQYADKVGVHKRDPFINTDKGDILLFLFCFSGLAAGFYLGYNWKKIISEKPDIKAILEANTEGGEKAVEVKSIE